jgi:hypothetical protein
VQTVETTNPIEARRCRRAQHRGRPAELRLDGSRFFGIVRAVQERPILHPTTMDCQNRTNGGKSLETDVLDARRMPRSTSTGFMLDRPQKITFAEMRDMGVRGILVYLRGLPL